MFIRRDLTLLALAALLPIGAALPVAAQSSKRERGVFLEKDALMLDVAEVIAGGVVQDARWSPSGRYVLAQRTPIRISEVIRAMAAGKPPEGPPPMELVLWDRQSRKSREISLGRTANAPHPSSFFWTGDVAMISATVLVPPANGLPSRPETWLYRFDPRSGTAPKPLTRLADDEMLDMRAPGSYAVMQSLGSPQLRIVQPDGRLLTVRVPGVNNLQMLGWSADRRQVLIQGIIRNPERKGIEVRPLMVDAATGRIAPRPEDLHQFEPAPWSREYSYQMSPVRVGAGAGATTLFSLWLVSPVKSEMPTVMVAADVEKFTPSPAGDAVLYVTDGSAWVAELARLPRQVLAEARDAARRQVLMSNGKQVATSVLMYAQDYDETLPGAGDDLMEKLMPYSKNEAIFQGLVYTFAGGKLSEVEEPSKTVLGHIPGPGGRAVLYVDGHVTWEKDK